MARGRAPPIPQPMRPQDTNNEVNYLTAQVQQILAFVLPAPLVTILASVSDLLYRAILGQTNDPPSYLSTLLPPVLLLVVTYLAGLLVYRSIRSFFSLLLFSLKWIIILGVLGFILAYHLGNGDMEKGAHEAVQKTGVANAIRKYPMAYQYFPFFSNLPQQLGAASGVLPSLQSISPWLFQSDSEQHLPERQDTEHVMSNPGARSKDKFREYRDVRPQRHEYKEATAGNVRTQAQPDRRREKMRSKGEVHEQANDLFSKISKWMGADLNSASDSKR